MTQADGSIIFNTELDNSGLERGLEAIKAETRGVEHSLKGIREQIKGQEKEVKTLTGEYAKLETQAKEWASMGLEPSTGFLDEMAAAESKMFGAQKALDGMRQQEAQLVSLAARLAEEQKGAEAATKRMNKHAKAVGNSFRQISRRLGSIVSGVLVFNLISAGLRGMVEYMQKALATNDEFAASLAQLKGALLTAFQPLWETILPYLTKFVQVLSQVVMWIAAFFSWITGKSLTASAKNAKALNQQANALESVGAAAEEAKGSLADFDEVNVIAQSEPAGGGGGGGGANAPAFDFDTEKLKEMEALLDRIGWLVAAVGAGLLAWRIARGLGVLPQYAAAIGLIAAGLVAVISGFKEWAEAGELTDAALTKIVAGLLLIGAGIAILTGSWIPLLIAAIASLALILVKNFGDAEKLLLGLKTAGQGLVDFFVGIFTGDLNRAILGLSKIFSGLDLSVAAVIEAAQNAFNSFLDWLDEKTGGKLHNIIEAVRETFNDGMEKIKKYFSVGLQFIEDLLKGLTKFLFGVFTGDWDKAWEGIKDIAKGALNLVAALAESAINKVIGHINVMIRGINDILSSADGLTESIFGKTLRIPEIKDVSIPRLAQGAVVPANREFLAVLGDNKRETEVVSPLSIIRQAVMEAMAAGGGGNGDMIALLRQQNELLMQLLEKELTLGEPSASFGRFASRSITKYEIVKG